MTRLQAGDRINNYLLDERVGQGAFGEVWKAHHHVFGDVVAIKIPTSAEYVRHLRQEGVTLHGLKDARIVKGLDLDPYADPPYLIMEYVDGPSLREILDLHPNGLTVETALEITASVLSALKVAHDAGIVHRDIKPANILLAGGLDAPPSKSVKLSDFGLGKVETRVHVSMAQSLSTDAEDRSLTGTPAYMSPEQRDGDEPDARSDLYSVGVVLHEMLTGHLPSGGDRPSDWRDGIPSWLDELFARCYCARERRFAGTGEMLEALAAHGISVPLAATQDSSTTPVESHREERVAVRDGRCRCVKCEGVVLPEDHFCVHCGFQLVDEVPRCPTCHAFASVTDRYCIRCGTDLREG